MEKKQSKIEEEMRNKQMIERGRDLQEDHQARFREGHDRDRERRHYHSRQLIRVLGLVYVHHSSFVYHLLFIIYCLSFIIHCSF